MRSLTLTWLGNQNAAIQPDSEMNEQRGEVVNVPAKNLPVSVPNGGFVAWLQCASSFALFMASWGIVSSFGISTFSLQ